MRTAILLTLALTSCTQPERALSTDLASTPTVWAMAQIRRPASLSDVEGGLPTIVPPRARPVVGRQFLVCFTTRPSAPFPDNDTVLLVSLERPDEAVLPGTNGGTLMVHPQFVFTPKRGNGLANGFLTQEDGRVLLNVEFAPAQVGAKFYAQLLVKDPRTELAVTATPMLEVMVGNR